MSNTINVRFQQKIDTFANWTEKNPVLLAGEIGIESDTNKFKFGDGSTPYLNLPYAGITPEQLEAIEDNYYSVTAAEGETDSAALAREITAPKKGDIAVVVRPLYKNADGTWDKETMTAYTYSGTAWGALDGNYDADNVYFDDDFVYTQTVGALTLGSGKSSDTYAAKGKNLKQVLSAILAKEAAPSISSNPAVTTKLANNNTPGTSDISVEGGTTVTPKWSATLSSGAYKYGPATGITAKTWSVTDNRKSIDSTLTNNTSTSNSGTFDPITIPAGASYKVSATATYDAAPLAYTNLGEEYKAGNALFDATPNAKSIQIAGGSKSDDSPTISAWQQGYYIGTLETDVPVTSNILRNVGDGDGVLKNRKVKGGNYAATGTTDLSFEFSGKMAKFVVAYPEAENRVGLKKFFNNTGFEEYVNNFSKETVLVAGADNDLTSTHAKNYTVCTWTPAAAYEFTSDAPLKVLIGLG